MLSNIGPFQLLIVLAIVLAIFGTKRLRTLGSDLGSAVKGFRSAVNEADKEPSEEIDFSESNAANKNEENNNSYLLSESAMSGIGFWELIILFLIGLIVLGPKRLPQVANQIGEWIGQAKRMTRVMRRQLEEEIEMDDPLESLTLDNTKKINPDYFDTTENLNERSKDPVLANDNEELPSVEAESPDPKEKQ